MHHLGAEKTVPRRTVFWATVLGYLGNSFLPARAGELLRSVSLGRAAGLSISFVLATALTERGLDVVALVSISLLAAMALEGLPEWLVATTNAMRVIALLGVVGLVPVPRLERQLQVGLARLPMPSRLAACLAGVVSQFLLGMRAFQHPGRALGFAGLAAALWLMDAVGAMLVARALELALTLPQALLLLAALGLSSAVPSTPGYVGVFQFVAVTVLAPFGFSQGEALAYILVSQVLSYGVWTGWGVLGLWRLAATRPGQVRLSAGYPSEVDR